MKIIQEVASALGLEYYSGRACLEIVLALDRLRLADELPKPEELREESERFRSVMEMLPGSEVDFGAARGFWNGHQVLMAPDLTEQVPVVAVLFSQPLGLGLRMFHEGFLERMSKVLGFQDVELGHPELDRLVMVKASDEAGVRARFGVPAAQTALLSLFEGWPEAVVNDVGVRAAGGDLAALVLALGRVADSLDAG